VFSCRLIVLCVSGDLVNSFVLDDRGMVMV